MNEKSYKYVLVYKFSYRILIQANPMCYRFNKLDGFIRLYNGSRYLVLFGHGKWGAIYNSIRNLISQNSRITYVFLIITQESKLFYMIPCLNDVA